MKYRIQISLSSKLGDINPLYVGEADLFPKHSWGPGSLNYVLLHKIIKGQGTLYIGGKTYHPKAGDAFLLMPGETAHWVTDEKDPWQYQWITFSGTLAAEFAQLPAVFPLPDGSLPHMESINFDNPEDNLGYLLAGDLLHLYATLIKPQKNHPDHILRAIDYIQLHYADETVIQKVASHVGLNRDYFTRLFKQKTGTTLQDHILDVRLKKAKDLMYEGYSIKEASFLSGFKDTSNFSKRFKKKEGLCPKQWMKEIHDPNSPRRLYTKNDD